jgi:hypothetical protein
MNFIRRRTTLLTREEIMGSILEGALEGAHLQATEVAFPRPGEAEEAQFRQRTHAACEQAMRELQVLPEETAVACGILAQQVALEQAVQLVEQKVQRKLTPTEKERILQNLPRVLAAASPLTITPSPTSEVNQRVRGPRSYKDLWGH